MKLIFLAVSFTSVGFSPPTVFLIDISRYCPTLTDAFLSATALSASSIAALASDDTLLAASVTLIFTSTFLPASIAFLSSSVSIASFTLSLSTDTAGASLSLSSFVSVLPGSGL